MGYLDYDPNHGRGFFEPCAQCGHTPSHLHRDELLCARCIRREKHDWEGSIGFAA
jgi:hypothetical protein